MITEWEAKRLLGDIPRPREALTRSLGEALDFARGVGGPVVAKASGLEHKTERGGVRLDADLGAVWAELAGLGDGTVLVAEQVSGELELIAGGARDPQFGPVVALGLGGVAAEVFGDVAFMLSPAGPDDLEQAVGRLRCGPLLHGHRGRPPVDRAGLLRIVRAIGRLLEQDPLVSAVDCNPVLVRAGSPLVLDALVIRG